MPVVGVVLISIALFLLIPTMIGMDSLPLKQLNWKVVILLVKGGVLGLIAMLGIALIPGLGQSVGDIVASIPIALSVFYAGVSERDPELFDHIGWGKILSGSVSFAGDNLLFLIIVAAAIPILRLITTFEGMPNLVEN